MDRTINTPIAPATLALAEQLLAATWTANAQEPYVAADYDAPYAALMALLTASFGEDATAVREATYDGNTVAQAIEWAKADARSRAADAYEVAVDRQAEQDALRAFDRITEGWCVEANLRTFAAATDHLDRHGMVLALDLEPAAGAVVPSYRDRDDADAAMAARAHLVTV